jgi:hypothetical protein
MTDAERIEAFLINSGFTPQSLDTVRPDFPRWLTHLRNRGVTHIPTAPWMSSSDDSLASNLLNQLALQASSRQDPAIRAMKHNLRNLTRTRPYKL